MRRTVGVYKARLLSSGEKVFHAPDIVNGEYYMVLDDMTGVVKYVPVSRIDLK